MTTRQSLSFHDFFEPEFIVLWIYQTVDSLDGDLVFPDEVSEIILYCLKLSDCVMVSYV
jgi:hypothetical protein